MPHGGARRAHCARRHPDAGVPRSRHGGDQRRYRHDRGRSRHPDKGEAVVQARASVLINCPVEMAFTFIADTASDRAWRSHLDSSRGRATAVGDRFTQTYSYQGTSKSVELEVSEFEPPERLGYTVSKPARAGGALRGPGAGRGGQAADRRPRSAQAGARTDMNGTRMQAVRRARELHHLHRAFDR